MEFSVHPRRLGLVRILVDRQLPRPSLARQKLVVLGSAVIVIHGTQYSILYGLIDQGLGGVVGHTVGGKDLGLPYAITVHVGKKLTRPLVARKDRISRLTGGGNGVGQGYGIVYGSGSVSAPV